MSGEHFRSTIGSILTSAVILAFTGVLTGCASPGPTIMKNYEQDSDRSQIAIVRLSQATSLTIVACDGQRVRQSVRYLLVQPGRHELFFKIWGQTLVQIYEMRGKKFLDAVGGHTYALKSETGFFAVGDKWFPEVIDVTDDPKLHVQNIPREEDKKLD